MYKTLSSTFIFLLLFSSTYGQLSQDDTTLLLSAIRQISNDTPIIYLDSIPLSPNKNLIEKIRSGKFVNTSQFFYPDTLFLSKKEQNYIISRLNTKTIWEDQLLPKSKKMKTDSMWTYLITANKKRTEEINRKLGEKSIGVKYSMEYSYVFSFTPPIYIRDNNICLISLTGMCGNSCGRTITSFYRKENNTWKEWIVISMGVF